MTKELGPHFFELVKEIRNNLSRNKGLPDILQFFCNELSELLHSPLVWIGLKEDDGTVRFAARAGDAALYLDTMTVRWDDSEYGNGSVGRAIKSGKPQLLDVRGEELYFLPWLKILRILEINTTLALPIFNSQNDVIGALALYSMDIDAYTDEQIYILETYCTQISIVIELEQARESLKHYELLSQHSRDIILFLKRDGSIVEANHSAELAYGYTQKELKNLTIYDLRLEEHEVVSAQMEKAEKDGGILFEAYHRRKDGSCFPGEVSSVGYRFTNQTMFLNIIRDITKQKIAEE